MVGIYLGNLARSDDLISTGLGLGPYDGSNFDNWESLWMYFPAISY